jgi:Transglycosylase SLT domain
MKRVAVLLLVAGCGVPAVAEPATTTTTVVPAPIVGPATGPLQPAVRINPPTTTTTVAWAPTFTGDGYCPQWELLLHVHNPGWDVGRMSAIMWRESRCFHDVRSRTSDSGLLQINDINHTFLRTALDEHVDRWTLLDADQNVRAAAALFRYWRDCCGNGYSPWKATTS